MPPKGKMLGKWKGNGISPTRGLLLAVFAANIF
jgi:hypothetical protein